MLNNIRKKQVNALFSRYKNKAADIRMSDGFTSFEDIYVLPINMRLSKTQKNSFPFNFNMLSGSFYKMLGVRMILCKPGSFQMGVKEWDNLKAVTIEKAFFLSEVPVTQRLYVNIMGGQNPSKFKGDDLRPVENISWLDAAAFCNKLSRMFCLPNYYDPSNLYREIPSSTGFRMPTEEEWEYAAKAGTENKWSGTNDLSRLSEYTWYPNPKSTQPVVSKLPNEWGFYGMSGNVYELCSNSKNFESRKRMAKGGSYEAYSDDTLYITNGVEVSLDSKSDKVGFRIAKTFC